jgi:hypothetical protein
MATINLSIGELFLRTYGGASGPITVGDVKGVAENYRRAQGKTGSPFYAKDFLGREYYMPLEVNVGNAPVPGEPETTYADKLGVRNEDGSATGRWNLPHPVISGELVMNVVDTELTERNGFVSERINFRGYRIRVRGFIMGDGNEFPEDDVETLERLVKLGIPVRISSVVTDLMLADVPDRLVTIRRLVWPEIAGVQHVKPYELELMSEVAFNLIDIS